MNLSYHIQHKTKTTEIEPGGFKQNTILSKQIQCLYNFSLESQ